MVLAYVNISINIVVDSLKKISIRELDPIAIKFEQLVNARKALLHESVVAIYDDIANFLSLNSNSLKVIELFRTPKYIRRFYDFYIGENDILSLTDETASNCYIHTPIWSTMLFCKLGVELEVELR